MALCHECGEKVAENDIFCPFCGISLEPISLGGADEVEFEKTVVMPLPAKPVTAASDLPPTNPQAKIAKTAPADLRQTTPVPVSDDAPPIHPPEPEILRN